MKLNESFSPTVTVILLILIAVLALSVGWYAWMLANSLTTIPAAVESNVLNYRNLAN